MPSETLVDFLIVMLALFGTALFVAILGTILHDNAMRRNRR